MTEVKFIKTFLHDVGEHCHGNKKVYIVNHKDNVHGKQFLVIIISSFSSCVPLLSIFRKSMGPCPALYKHYGLKNEAFSTRRLCEWSTSRKQVTHRRFIAAFSHVNAFYIEIETE